MLLELIVENYAVVEQARIRFYPGLNLLTGETGSGKSIVVDSFSLLLGARASAEMVRSGAAKARVSGLFSIEETAQLQSLLTEAGIEHEAGDDLIVEREVLGNGKSRAFVANRLVTTGFLRQLAPTLGDIHGQNEQQLLFTTQRQRELLDDYAGLEELLGKVSGCFTKWRAAGIALEEWTRTEAEKLRLLDLWNFQRSEIETVAPVAGEDAALEAERRVLANTTRLEENANAVWSLLYDAPESAATQVRQASKRVEELVRIDPKLSEIATALSQASVSLEEAAYSVRDYLGTLEGDPRRLEEIESRLAALEKLRRKYGGTVEDVIAFGAQVARQASEVENATEHKAQLEQEHQRLAQEFEALAATLTRERKEAAAKLSACVEKELKSLAMGGTQFQISVAPAPPSSTGIDDIHFLVSPNRGEDLKPLERIASGGELSRIALALKTAAGTSQERRDDIHTLVFDEVDAGVGGAAAASVGRRLKALSQANQVICVTHLAQIAGFADHHYAVTKREKKGRVTTVIEELSHDDRAQEIGRMLSGDLVTPEALRQAEQLMHAGTEGR